MYLTPPRASMRLTSKGLYRGHSTRMFPPLRVQEGKGEGVTTTMGSAVGCDRRKELGYILVIVTRRGLSLSDECRGNGARASLLPAPMTTAIAYLPYNKVAAARQRLHGRPSSVVYPFGTAWPIINSRSRRALESRHSFWKAILGLLKLVRSTVDHVNRVTKSQVKSVDSLGSFRVQFDIVCPLPASCQLECPSIFKHTDTNNPEKFQRILRESQNVF